MEKEELPPRVLWEYSAAAGRAPPEGGLSKLLHLCDKIGGSRKKMKSVGWGVVRSSS